MRGGLVETVGGVLARALGPHQVGVCGAGLLQLVAAGGQFAIGATQQGLGVLGVRGHQILGQRRMGLAVRGCEPLRFPAQPAELLARAGRTGLQLLHQRLRAGGRGLAGRPVGAVGALQELRGAGADLVAEPVQRGQGRGLVALGAGLFGAQVGADADLLVQLGGRAYASRSAGSDGCAGALAGLRRCRRARPRSRPARRAAHARCGGRRRRRAARRGGPRRRRVRGPGRSRPAPRPPLPPRRVAEPGEPAGALAQPEGQSRQGVGTAPGPLRLLLPLVPYAGGLGGGLVGLLPGRAGPGEMLRGPPRRPLGRAAAAAASSASRPAGSRCARTRGVPRARGPRRGGRRAYGSPRRGRAPGGAAPAAPRRRPVRRAWPGSAARGRRPRACRCRSRAAGASSAAAVPTATAERGSNAAWDSTSRARAWLRGSVMMTPSTSSGRAASTSAWSAGSTAWAR